LIVKEIEGRRMTKYRHMYRRNPKVNMAMRVWGEAGIGW
jgi:hypothetical protein